MIAGHGDSEAPKATPGASYAHSTNEGFERLLAAMHGMTMLFIFSDVLIHWKE